MKKNNIRFGHVLFNFKFKDRKILAEALLERIPVYDHNTDVRTIFQVDEY